MSIQALKEKAVTYSISQEYIDSKERGRLAFVTKFPIDKISELSLDEYVLGTDKESFCYWLEFKKIEDKVIQFGIGGGNASKFGLYKTKDGSYQIGFGDKKKVVNGKELEDCFSSIKNIITLAIKYVSENRVSEIKKMNVPFGNMILQKILSIYYPDKFITIGSSNVLIDFAKYINLQNIDLNPDNLIEINYECKKVIDAIPEFKNWSYEKIGSFVWNYFDGENKKGNKKDNVNYYLVGAYWGGSDQTNRFIENGIWENGYDDKFIDEVNAVPVGSKIAIKAAFTREKTKSVMAIKAIGTVLENLNNGKNLVVEWDGDSHPFEVDFSGGYWTTIKEVKNKSHINAIFYRETNHTNNFELIKDKFKVSVFTNYINLLRELIKELKIQNKDQRIVYSVRDNRLNFIVGQRYCFNLYVSDSRGIYGVISKEKLTENSTTFEGTPPQPYYSYFNDFKPNSKEWESIVDSINDELNRTSKSGYRKFNDEDFENFVFSNIDNKNNIQMNYPLNTILYGPPGTGKTYNSIDKAVAIATGSSSDHISNKMKFDDLRKQGQIEFVTFHQNYSYEDFMVGIRPNVSETTSELSFKKHYGIFYEIAKRARENYDNSLKDEQTISRENWVNTKFEEFKEYVESEIEENGKFAIKNNVSIYSVEDEVFIYTGEKENGDLWKNQRIGMHYDALINIYLADVQNRQDLKKLENVPSLEKQHATYSFELIEKFRQFLIEKGYKFQAKTVQKEPLNNFVLIIDEINRANISKVFGELITLLEDDKRLGNPNELKITLPNGEKEFGVPPNLYIIGTMNTADKSIALIDIALRRRFEFIGYYPDCENEKLKPEAKTLLQKINEEIYKLKNSADYLIGHAYFMKDEAIETTLRTKVVPLLMEYFSGKTKIVSDIFNETNWKVEYDTTKFNWSISQR
ncbi:MAG: AAA family ATPase [Candidatus Kapabacteria bacterium]|nr:AAA family ATPase [Candidatus Kapabacteria bacterium]